jgi:sulfite reductase beta subunit-like hemoprotein
VKQRRGSKSAPHSRGRRHGPHPDDRAAGQREFVPLDQLITYAEACLRVYNRYGRRDNKYKARIKILVHELGKDEYTRQVEEEFAHLLTQGSSRLWPNWSGSRRTSPIRPMMHRPMTTSTARPGLRSLGRPQLRPHKQPGYMPSPRSASSRSAASPAMPAPTRCG